jgi:hypothetical protein
VISRPAKMIKKENNKRNTFERMLSIFTNDHLLGNLRTPFHRPVSAVTRSGG